MTDNQLEVIVAIEHVRYEFDDERFVGLVAENRLLHEVDGLLRNIAGRCQFGAALTVFFAEHVQTTRTATVVERAHLRAGDKRVALVPEDDVELLADRLVDNVEVHPGAARKQDNLLPFLLELEPVQRSVHRVGAFGKLLAHVGVDHADNAVHQDFHLSWNAEEE